MDAFVKSANCCSSNPRVLPVGTWGLADSLKRRQKRESSPTQPRKNAVKKGEITPPHNVVFLTYKSVIRNTVVPLPVCSGADWCTISVLLKPYLCNWSLRVCLTCGWSRFQLCSPPSLRCPSGKMSVHYQGFIVIWFLLECLTVSLRFLLLGRRGSLSWLAWSEPLITFSF